MYSLKHLSDSVLTRDLLSIVAQRRRITAEELAHIAEFDARKLYAPAGYSSMYSYCIEQLNLSDQAAYKRIHAGRAAIQYPLLFECLADGRLHLTAIGLLAPYLNDRNLSALVNAATRKTKGQIETLLAERYP